MKQTILSFLNKRQLHCPNTINEQFQIQLVSCQKEKQEAIFSFHVKAWHLNVMHTMHGGAIAFVADVVMGALSSALYEGADVVTMDMHIRYLEPVYENEMLFFHVYALYCGKKRITLEVDVHTSNHQRKGIVTGSFYVKKGKI